MINKLLKIILYTMTFLFTLLSVILFLVFVFNRQFFSTSGILDIELAADFGSFFQGLVGTSAGISASLLIICVFFLQQKQEKISQIENIFYKMLDYHRDNVNSIKVNNYKLWMNDTKEKTDAFVNFKLQIFDCVDMINELNKQLDRKLNRKETADAAYMVFYYGIDKRWLDFTKKLLGNYDGKLPGLILNYVENQKTLTFTDNRPKDIGRTNQNILSVYFRNMYNAIMVIHKSGFLNDAQKKRYVRVLRAQLSNPELVVLFFNLLSGFGRKWDENGIIAKYEFIKNLPSSVCNGYDPKEYYQMEYEEDETDDENWRVE